MSTGRVPEPGALRRIRRDVGRAARRGPAQGPRPGAGLRGAGGGGESLRTPRALGGE